MLQEWVLFIIIVGNLYVPICVFLVCQSIPKVYKKVNVISVRISSYCSLPFKLINFSNCHEKKGLYSRNYSLDVMFSRLDLGVIFSYLPVRYFINFVILNKKIFILKVDIPFGIVQLKFPKYFYNDSYYHWGYYYWSKWETHIPDY